MNESASVYLNFSSIDKSLQFIRSICLGLCISGGLFVNILFIVIIFKSKNFHRRSLFGLCINLSCIFFVDIVLNQIITLVSSINEYWIFPDVVCIIQSTCITIVDTCLSLTLFMFGIDRLISVRANLNDKTKLAKGLNADAIILSTLCLWLLSICVSIPLITKTINSTYVVHKFSCGPTMNENLIYKISLFCLTIGGPGLCVLIMYVYIIKVWCKAKPQIVASNLREKFQIEKEVNNSICTFVYHFFWLLTVGPYIVWLYIPTIPNSMTVAFVWLRNFYCWLPFFITVICHKSFRKRLVILLKPDRICSATTIIDPNPTTSGINSQENTFSTNLAFTDSSVVNNDKRYSIYSSEYGNSSRSLSYCSSIISSHRTEHLPKVPVMFATVRGVHVINEYFPEISQSTNASDFPAILCDVHEAGFTDTSDAASMTTNNSFKANKLHNQSGDIKLPADIIDTFNPDGFKHKRLKRRPQSNSQIKSSLQQAFELPTISSTQNPSLKENTPKKLRKKKRPPPPIPVNNNNNNIINNPTIMTSQSLHNIDPEIDLSGATDA